MKALAVCCTYGRLPYLGKMLASFISQTYDDKHLVVINDDKNIKLECDRSDVSVINCNQRMTIGSKRNLGVAYGNFDIIFPWDDDDIFYPSWMYNHVKQYADPEVKAYRNYAAYIIYADKFAPHGGGMNSKSYLKTEWYRCGGYNPDLHIGEDTNLHCKLQGFKTEDNPDERDFMYGFSTSNYHLSNQHTHIDALAFEQLQNIGLVGKSFNIKPDLEEYNKYLILDKLYKERQVDLEIRYLSDGNITIDHLL
jgi:glycosyltransferase involved in cell wall biosynthesis